jgi:predicted enzyme related to lactoylglutathione lyase
MGCPVVHFEIIAKDGPKLQRFYADLFDWQIDANNPQNYGLVETGGEGGINGGIGPGEPTGITFYVQVRDLQAALEKAEKLGGKTLMPPMEVPGAGVTLAMFSDVEGNRVGLLKG